MEISAIKGGGEEGGRRLMAHAIKNFYILFFTTVWE